MCHGFASQGQIARQSPTTLSMASSSEDGSLVGRRQALSTVAATIAAGVLIPTGPAFAVDACPPGSKNCVRQTWTPPSGTSAADAVAQLRSALNEYPLEGQEDGKVDGGGYKVISDGLGDGGAVTLEYSSSGKGTFAKLFNGGKSFVDDLIVEQSGSSFDFRSSSRVGDSDFGVNGKRLGYIGGLLKGKGWSGQGLPN